MNKEITKLSVDPIFAHSADPKVLDGKFITVTAGGEENMACGNCGKIVDFTPNAIDDVDSIACSNSCADILYFAPERQKAKEKRMQEAKDRIESDALAAEAIAAGETPAVKPSELPENCSECNGPKRGRGYTHTDGCSLSKGVVKDPNKVVATCPACGGPAKGRGFTHKSGCSDVAKKQAALAAELANKPKCSVCGGAARGRGFSHKPDCSLGVTSKEA